MKNLVYAKNVIVVTVTYGNRFKFLKQVIDSVLVEGIESIIVIDNNSKEESKSQLAILEQKLNKRLEVVWLEKNTGSAGGFSRGLKEAMKKKYDFIWLLDDDNKVTKESLQALLCFYNKWKLDNSNTLMVSLRRDREQYYKSIIQNDQTLLTGTNNSFMAFDVFSYVKRKFRKTKTNPINCEYAEIGQAPYGGMFFHRNLVDKIGFPNEDFFVYTDDTEYSYRVIRQGGRIYAITNSLLEDIDVSWHNKTDRNIKSYNPVLDSDSEFRIYYSFRNRVFFEYRKRVDNKFLYFFNMTIFMSYLFFKAIGKRKIHRFYFVCLSIVDGLKGKLGESDKLISGK